MRSADSSPSKEFEVVQDSQISEFDSPLITTGTGSLFRDDDDDDDDEDKVQPNFISDTENDSLNSDEDLSTFDGDLALSTVKSKTTDDFDPILKEVYLPNGRWQVMTKTKRPQERPKNQSITFH